jgi:uncharacterized membrane protein YhaH (DUF805 family)
MKTPEQLKQDEDRMTFKGIVGLAFASALCFVVGFLLVESRLARTSLIILGSASALFTLGAFACFWKETLVNLRRLRDAYRKRRYLHLLLSTIGADILIIALWIGHCTKQPDGFDTFALIILFLATLGVATTTIFVIIGGAMDITYRSAERRKTNNQTANNLIQRK